MVCQNFEDLKSQFEFSDDWKEETSKKAFDKAGKDFSKMIKDAVDTFKGSFDHSRMDQT